MALGSFCRRFGELSKTILDVGSLQNQIDARTEVSDD